MGFLRIFKKDKEKGERKTAEKAQLGVEEKAEKQEERKPSEEKGSAKPQFTSSDRNILRPLSTEKATRLASSNQYVFLVRPNATKNELKGSIKQLYRVDVEKVRIIRVPAKRVRIGRFEGVKSGYKKAIVTIAKGQKIEVLPR